MCCLVVTAFTTTTTTTKLELTDGRLGLLHRTMEADGSFPVPFKPNTLNYTKHASSNKNKLPRVLAAHGCIPLLLETDLKSAAHHSHGREMTTSTAHRTSALSPLKNAHARPRLPGRHPTESVGCVCPLQQSKQSNAAVGITPCQWRARKLVLWHPRIGRAHRLWLRTA